MVGHQSSSRLNRLLTLLDTGSTQATRFAAARQIGDIAKLHPHDLTSLLKKVAQYLHSKNWDTRVAAAQAIGAIADNVKNTSLSELVACVESKLSEAGISGVTKDVLAWPDLHSKTIPGISFRSMDINKVLEFGALLASGGQEYDVAIDNTKNPRERLARQKQNLRRRLGLDVCEQFMDVNDMIRDEDLMVHKFNSHGGGLGHIFYTSQPVHNIQHLVANMVPNLKSKRPSARELNLLKRKAKFNSKDQIKTWPEDADAEVFSECVTTPKGLCSGPLNSTKVDMDAIPSEENLVHDGDEQWPFHTFVEQLLLDMFDPVWEIRHGSIMALREILTHQGASAGIFIPELSSDGALFSGLKSGDNLNVMKREREIDLNLQVSGEESEPDLKRPKLEYAPEPNIPACNGNIDIPVKTEDNGSKVHIGQVNGQLNVSSAKVEHESYLDGAVDTCKDAVHKEDSNGYPQLANSIERMDILKSLPENSELMNLVKLARHYWLQNCEFLQDCAIRFLCVLSLDRFGDYVSDQVVAPVRETCAQALGVVIKFMHPSMVHETLKILLQMQHRPEWEIRHGSLLGIKYLVAVRKEMLHALLGSILPACKLGLEDPDDDVRAVAADAMMPTATAIISLEGETLHSIIMLLWDILLDLDDLSPSTSSVMNLLAEIYSHEEMIPRMFGEFPAKNIEELDLNEIHCGDGPGEGIKSKENPYMLSVLAPRLWPFMRHSISSVRYSAIRTLERLLEAGYKRSISELSAGSFWPSYILGDTLRIVFQNLLLESNDEVLKCSERVWRTLVQCPVEDLQAAARSFMSFWIELTVTPYGSPLDATKMFWPVALPRKSHFKAAAKMRAAMLENGPSRNIGLDYANGTSTQETHGDVSMNSVKIIVGADLDMSITRTRAITAAALGIFASKLHEGSVQYVIDPLWNALISLSGVQRQVASMVLMSWFLEIKHLEDNSGTRKVRPCLSDHFKNWLVDLLACADPAYPTKDTFLPYAELSRTYAKMRSEASHLFHAVESSGLSPNIISTNQIDFESLSADGAIDFASKLSFMSIETTENHAADDLESLKQRLITTSGYLKCVQGNLHVSVTALVAAAVIWISELPARLNPVILPIMASIKREQEEILQQKAAEALAELISQCIPRRPGPNDKLIKNICGLTCMDPCETPQAAVVNSIEIVEDQDLLSFGICTVKPKSKVHLPASGENRSKVEGFISRRGSELALKQLCIKFGASLFDKLPKVWDCLTEVLKPAMPDQLLSEYEKQISQAIDSIKDPQILINNIQLISSITSMLDQTLKLKLLSLLPCIFKCVCHAHVAVRLAASRCITSMAKSMTKSVMGAVLENGIPMLGDMTSVHTRHGAGMVFSLLVQGLGVELVAYATLLVVPLLRCMSDCNPSVRHCVTRTFAALVPLLPLARGIPPPEGLGEGLATNTEDVHFLEQLLDNSHVDDYKLQTTLKVTLRRYQQEGINWLAFLRRFKLHGILCDDMGLGKTLQASAILASDISEHRSLCKTNVVPSLIVCPSTLVGHWAYEIDKYIDASAMTILQYVGSSQERISLQNDFDKHSVIITSYDVVRKDIDHLEQLLWNYCILDEGHIIKNAKSKITKSVKQLKSQHRLILSGTPIQNNVLDLWSLFDFLMPGFLGTEKQFQATFGKPLLAARDPKCSAKDAEAGALAMEALHKQVMPFLLRRTKDEVLSDLPEKIIQDRFCDLSPVQLKLYDQFSGSHVRQEISSMVKSNESANTDGVSPKASTHVFQALQYLLKLCSHPLLVVGSDIPDSLTDTLSELFPQRSDIISELHKLHHSPKLIALQEILEECGIGIDTSSTEGTITVGLHRVLIFAQHKAFLDIIERDLFHTHMKNVTYLRLDGSVQAEKRFEIVKSFNSDPTIDVLLLTTHVGGLGLNLTSADTIVFVEHDWNPMRDHQAMDRAHRLGQRKVVNVHRLIMRATIEEKVMSLQKFKVSVANAVINAENSSMKTMNTDQLLDLFTPTQTTRKVDNQSKNSDSDFDEHSKSVGGSGKGIKAILGGLEELWDQSQYTEEYNLSQFLSKLNG